ncbi:MAG: antibiotic biosynthesis monooxygenase [Planctomycetota bacterium]|nr:antibiotic biosynthesis monooxygenase [Planctomycetota bacterium]
MTSEHRIGFCVLYRFRVHVGKERDFQIGWARLTEAIRDQRGGLGSRLHHVQGDLWLAYAQWPDRGTWEASQGLPSADPAAAAQMSGALIESLEPMLLEPTEDLLVRAPLAERP